MKHRPASATLREWRAFIVRPIPLAIMAAAALVLTILGPFDTGRLLSALPRFGYWLLLVACTYGAGLYVNLWGAPRLPGAWPLPARVAVLGLMTGLSITPIVLVLNAAIFGHVPGAAELPGLLAQFLVISVAVTMVFELLTHSAAQDDAAGPAILDRLPLDKRGALLSLSAEDHYTRIRTTRGEAMVLLRLADAMRETAPVAGHQVHRSHWVAFDAVTAAERRGDGARVTLRDGTEIPVSRANVAALRDAGLLPR